jgi:small subunit ribosomal protein S16
MAVKMRLQRKGRKKQPFYHIVIADARSPRDGRFIEKLGVYTPMTKPATIDLDRDKAYDWLLKGAQPTETVRAILRFKGVLYRKHLIRGVNKGAMTQEEADRLYQEWIDAKEAKVAARVEQTKEERAQFLKQVSGKAAPKPAEPVVIEDAGAELDATEAEAPAAEAEAEAVEEAPAAEAEVTEEAPAEAEAPAAEEAAEEEEK